MLGAVKKEFETFGGLLQKARTTSIRPQQLDDVVGKRTRAIQQELKGVEALNEGEEKGLLSDVPAGDWVEEEE